MFWYISAHLECFVYYVFANTYMVTFALCSVFLFVLSLYECRVNSTSLQMTLRMFLIFKYQEYMFEPLVFPALVLDLCNFGRDGPGSMCNLIIDESSDIHWKLHDHTEDYKDQQCPSEGYGGGYYMFVNGNQHKHASR